MLIADARIHCLRIPFEDGSRGEGLMPSRWTHLDMVLLRLETGDGLVGWGEAFSYACRTATAAALKDMVLPLVVGQTVTDVAAFTRGLQQKLHLQGRFGITSFALSAVDIALVDLAVACRGPVGGAVAGRGSGERSYRPMPAWCATAIRSRLRSSSTRPCAQGYQSIKLHEITQPAITAAREAAPALPRLVTDVNCNWSMDEARRLLPAMRDMDLYWVEGRSIRPTMPRCWHRCSGTGVAMASGENAATSEGFPGSGRCDPLRAAQRHQGRRHHRTGGGVRSGPRARLGGDAPLAVLRPRLLGHVAGDGRTR
ncbi:MAG: hypothetical protein R3E68_19090 [Burkholderiaceae bacterium]